MPGPYGGYNPEPAEPAEDAVQALGDFIDLDSRIQAFADMGFALPEALALAWNDGVSPATVRELIRHGCDPHTAAQIVL